MSTWIVRGFGTALMHGGTTALFAVMGLARIERAPHGVPGSGRVTECVTGDRLQQAGERQPGRRGDGYGAGQDRRQRGGGRVRVILGDPQRG